MKKIALTFIFIQFISHSFLSAQGTFKDPQIESILQGNYDPSDFYRAFFTSASIPLETTEEMVLNEEIGMPGPR